MPRLSPWHSAAPSPLRIAAGALSLIGMTLAASAPVPQAPKRPNILFIAVDDLRPELGCYGTPVIQTPNIDRLARSGVVFTRAYCQQAVCSPSRTSLLTGARPDTTQVWDLVTHFRAALPDVVTLPQLFKQHGYTTQGMGKIYHGKLNDDPSWSRWTAVKAPHAQAPRTDDPDLLPTFAKKPLPLAVDGSVRKAPGPAVAAPQVADNAMHDGALADEAVAALKTFKQEGKPFFLAVGFVKPHLPFIAPKPYWDRYDRAKIPQAPNPFRPKGAPEYAIPDSSELRLYDGVPDAPEPISPALAATLKHGYYAAVSYMDAQVGRVLDTLEAQGLKDNTIVVLWGDHGWKLGEHGAWGKHTNLEKDTRAPLILSVPGMKTAGKPIGAFVEFVDLYPSLAELAGLPLPGHLEGLSFKPLLENPAQPWKQAAFSQFPRGTKGKALMGYTMRTERYRYTRWVMKKDPTQVDAEEVYDHQADPQENVNLAADPAQKPLVERLAKQWAAGWKAALPPKRKG